MYLQIKVIPQSQRTEFVERMADETIKIRLNATPEKGKANAALTRFLAKELNCQNSDILIVSGHTDRRKLVKVPDNCTLPW